MLLEFIGLNSLPVVAVNCDNQKAMKKEKWHRTRLEKSAATTTTTTKTELGRKQWQNGNQN